MVVSGKRAVKNSSVDDTKHDTTINKYLLLRVKREGFCAKGSLKHQAIVIIISSLMRTEG